MKKRFLTIHINLKLTMLLVGLFFCAIIAKLSYVVLSPKVDGINLTEFANNRNTVKETIYAERGTIFDRDGKPLAKNANSYKMIAYLSDSREDDYVVDKDTTANMICKTLVEEEEKQNACIQELTGYFSQDLYQVELGAWGKLSEEEKRKIEALELPGIDFVTLAKKRQYMNSSWASYILGYARSNDEGYIEGEMGIEAYFDDELKGKDGFIEYQKDAYGYRMANTPVNEEEAVSGSDIYLTINSDIQNVLENAISTFSKDNSFDWTILTVMDAKTGEIVGSASNPSFNPNNLNGLDSYLNPLVGYQYEPGSTMKTFSWMAAMENGVYDENATYLSGQLKLSDGTVVPDFNKYGWGNITYDTGYAYSSNVGAANLGLKLGTAKLTDFYTACGFGEKTGIALPAEEEGMIDFTYESELANASFGQGILVTPIQMLQGLSVVANDGVLIQPQLVKKIVNKDGKTTFEASRTEVRRVASHETAEKMKQLMYKVIYDGFDYNKEYAPEGITVIGKTGTAEIASDTGGYLSGTNDYIRSFAGMFPYEDPKYIIYFATKRNTGGNLYVTVSNVIRDIASVTNLTEAKNDVDQDKIVTIPQYVSMPLSTTLEDIKKRKLQAVVIGNGDYVVEQYPEQNRITIDQSKIFLKTNGTEIKMADVTGWSTNEVICYCNFIGLAYKLNGYGKVKTSSIPKDTVLNLEDMVLEITLE